jgi:sialic acid synthase SpsE
MSINKVSQRDKELFENLFVLELANNHWGKLERGLKIIHDHGTVVRYNNVKAAIKLQFRDVDEFIHPDFKGSSELRYIKKTEDTKLSKADFTRMVEEIKNIGCIPMSTPFDEASVDLCVEFDMPIIKIASSDMNDWVLIEKIASTRRPTIVSTGGASEKDLDDLVHFFEKRDIPLAINHCVSLYPSEDSELQLDQIDYLRERYPNHVIGLSTHEYHDWSSSMLISYGKGASAILILIIKRCLFLLIVHCPSNVIHGLRHSIRLKKCAAEYLIRDVLFRVKRLNTLMHWFVVLMPNMTWRLVMC